MTPIHKLVHLFNDSNTDAYESLQHAAENLIYHPDFDPNVILKDSGKNYYDYFTSCNRYPKIASSLAAEILELEKFNETYRQFYKGIVMIKIC